MNEMSVIFIIIILCQVKSDLLIDKMQYCDENVTT